MRARIILLLATLVILPSAIATAQSGTLTASDHIEILELYARYNYAFDSTDAKLLATVFTPDGMLLHRGTRALDMTKGWTPKAVPQVHHVTTSIVATASPEGARGLAYVTLVNLQATPPAVTGGGFYEDVLVKTPAGWRFKSRMFHSQTTPAAPPAAAPQSSTR